MTIRRYFVNVDGRQVHFRLSGQGPVLLLVHQSPMSSAEYEPLMKRLAEQYTVIASDNPGNGLSDPLVDPASSEYPEVEDFGDALARFLDCLSINRCLVYGFHTGATIALALASRHPDRIACAVVNGLPVMSEEETSELTARYLPPFEPSWDGAHLTWLWARLREQTIFYPWYQASEASRLAINTPTAETLTANSLEILRVGDSYRQTYRAAFRTRSEQLLRGISCPMVLMSAEWDPLTEGMETLPEFSEPIVRLRMGMGREEYIPKLIDLLPGWAERADTGLSDFDSSDFYFHEGLRCRGRVKGKRPIVVLHDHADDIDGFETLSVLEKYPQATLIDLPGHGESSEPWPENDRIASMMNDILSGLCPEGADLIGLGLGQVIASDIAGLNSCFAVHPDSRKPELTAGQWQKGSDLLARWSVINEQGAHLLAAWQLARDSALFIPWCDAGGHSARKPLGDLEPDRVHKRAVAAIKSRPAWCAAWNAIKPTGL